MTAVTAQNGLVSPNTMISMGAQVGIGSGLVYGIINVTNQTIIHCDKGFFDNFRASKQCVSPNNGAFEASIEYALSVPVKMAISSISSRVLGNENQFAIDVAASITSIGISALACQAGLGHEWNTTNFLITQGIGLGVTVGTACLNKGLEFINQKTAPVKEPVVKAQITEEFFEPTPEDEMMDFLKSKGWEIE